jgi:uncharacterized iron-regulated membrane protein
MSAVPPVSFRRSMSALHTWAGIVLGSVLFAIFWMGTLSVFDREIDRWMMPGTRLADPPPTVSLDAVLRPAADRLAAGSPQWSAILPTARTPTIQLRYQDPSGQLALRHIDPVGGAPVAPQGTAGGTGFIFPFHFSLHLKWAQIGYWLVGLAAMAMLTLLVSGVVIHRRIFKDFFTFRPGRVLSRSSLDLHNVTGVLALPFHFVMPLSGLIIFFSIYFPATWKAPYQGDQRAFFREVFGSYSRPKAGKPGTLASLDAMAAEAERRWAGGKVYLVRASNPRDAAAVVEMRRSFAHQVTMNRDVIYFDGTSGAVLHRSEARPVAQVQRFITGVHFVQFENWTLRWLYFLAGLGGCAMIATGFLFWLETRRAQHAGRGLAGVRVVEALAIGSVTGIVVATLAFFVANRMLPAGVSLAGIPRENLEMACFFLTWLATFGHAACRGKAAWGEQCRAIALLALGAAALNWVTTGDHPMRTLGQGRASAASMDLVLLAAAATALAAGRRIRRRLGRAAVPVLAASSPGEAATPEAAKRAAHG